MAGQFIGNKIKKYRKDHNNRDVEYYEDAQTGREVSPPREGEMLHRQHSQQGHGHGHGDEKFGGHGGYEEERHGRRGEHGEHGPHGHEHRSHSRHSSHSHGRRH